MNIIPKRILIARTDRLGDVVLSTPVIRYFREKYPDSYIAFMTRPYARDIVKNDPYIDEVILYDKDYSHKSLFGTIRFALSLKGKRFDTAIALHPTNRTHLIFYAAGIPARIGYDRNLPFLLTKRIKHAKQEGLMHEIDYNFDLLEKAGFDTSGADKMPYIEKDDSDSKVVDAILTDQGISGEMVAVHAGASCPSKRWPPEKFAEVCDALAAMRGYSVILVGGEETEKFSRQVMMSMKAKAHDLTDILRVGELAELLRRCRLFISNDSGPVHVSVAVGTPVISIFGRKDPGLSPKRWGPVGENDVVIHKDAGCVECLAHNCFRGFACLESVTVEEVMDAVRKILGSR